MRTIAAKLARIYLAVVLAVIFTSALVSQLYLYYHARTAAHDNLSTQAAALAGNLESAVAFGDADFAQQTLNALRHYPEVRMAAVILSDGKLFAGYLPQGGNAAEEDVRPYLTLGNFMAIGKHGITQTIERQGDAAARLVLVASLERDNREALRILAASTGIGALILLAAYGMFRRMSRSVTQPIEHLAAVMGRVEREGGQGQRAQVISDDEIGKLANGFNAMLSSLDKQSVALKAELDQRKQMEAQTIAAKNQLLATLDAIPDLMFEVGLDGRYHDYHTGRLDLLAAPPETLLGRTVSEVLPPDAAATCMLALREAHDNGHSHGRQFLLPLPQGTRWFEISAARKSVAEGQEPRFVVLSRDITDRKAAEDEVKNLAFYDFLTRLPNRRLLLDRLTQAMASSARSKKHGALLFIDLDNFKTLNDTFGHDSGDLLLHQAAQRLGLCVRKGDTVARLGGDEFVVILEDLSIVQVDAAAQVKVVGEKILAALNQPYHFDGYIYHNTASIGVTLFADHQETIDDLLKRADLAMYGAKADGRNALRFFDLEMQTVVAARADQEEVLREAIANDRFVLHYQVQVDGDMRPSGAEALVRLQHPRRGLVSPLEFIALAEDTGLILPLGQWVLKTACTQLTAWAACATMAHLTMAVNVSARQFRQKDFVDQVLRVIEQTGANPQRLKLELTESLLVENFEDVIAKMTALKAKGVRFSLDDFGTGYSSLSSLKRLPLDQLKIDRGFVTNILTDSDDAAIAKMIVALAESMGLEVIAEGVEIREQIGFLGRLGCHAYQGYLFSRPLPLDEFEKLVMRS